MGKLKTLNKKKRTVLRAVVMQHCKGALMLEIMALCPVQYVQGPDIPN